MEAVTKAGYQALPQVEGTGAEPTQDRQEVQTKKLWTRFVWSAVFTLPLLYLAMGPMLPWGGLPLPAFLNPAHQSVRYALTQLALTLPVVFLGRSFYIRGFKNLVAGHPNMDSLIAIGTSALLQGIIMTGLLAQGKVTVHHGGHPELYFEAAAVILTLITLGKYMEMV